MQGGGTTKQIARWVALGALFLIPLAPLVVANGYFFPFITGKAFFLRILIEVAVVAWVVLALLDKEYRPRFSWVGAVVVAFVAWMFVADLVAINVTKAFWSNFERMEGWVLLAHLLGFFFAGSAVLRAEEKWRGWFLWSLCVSVVLCVHAFFQLAGMATIHQGSTRIDASFGNSAYFAVYLLFSVFVALWLALTERRAWLKWALVLLTVVQGTLIFYTETRGTIIGLVAGLFLMALLTALTGGKRARTLATGGVIFILVVVGSFYMLRDTAFVQGNHVLQRIASISIKDGQTRFTIWGIAFEGVKERPLLGWGQEGFNYVFNTYYEPSLYGQESWFDRAHNAFIDWLSAGGVPAFLLYISLFLTAIVLLWRSSELSRPERIALTAALVGYAIHNMFVFDNLYSYIYFFAVLSLIHSQAARPIKSMEEAPVLSEEVGVTYLLPIAVVGGAVLFWFVNVPSMQTASKLIVALTPAQNSPQVNIDTFHELLQKPSFAAQEIREQLVNFAGSIIQSSATDEQKQQVATLAITEMQKQVEAYPRDARGHLQLSYAYRIAGATREGLQELEIGQTLSPQKIDIFIQKGMTKWDLGDYKGAREDLYTAYRLNPSSQELALHAAAGDIAAGDLATGNALLRSVYGTTTVDSNVLAIAYYRSQAWPSLISLWHQRAHKQDASVDAWISLAAVHYTSGDKESALRVIDEAGTRYPDAADKLGGVRMQIVGK